MAVHTQFNLKLVFKKNFLIFSGNFHSPSVPHSNMKPNLNLIGTWKWPLGGKRICRTNEFSPGTNVYRYCRYRFTCYSSCDLYRKCKQNRCLQKDNPSLKDPVCEKLTLNPDDRRAQVGNGKACRHSDSELRDLSRLSAIRETGSTGATLGIRRKL